jgi:cell division septation protein DedD
MAVLTRNGRPTAAPAQPRAVLTASAAVPPASSRSRFGVLGTAHAATMPPAATRPSAAPVAAGNGWGVQVGAFSSEAQARSAAGAARSGGGRAIVQPVAQGRTTLYRARVMGLSRGSAQQICDRMRGRGGCTLVSPEG